MRIKPKNPKALKLKRILLGLLGAAVVVVVLLYPTNNKTLVDDSTPVTDIPSTTAAPEEGEGNEIEWEYPPGWIDYSDLPDKSLLGDDDVRGLSNWRYLLVNGLDQENYLRDSYYPDMSHVENGYSFRTQAHDDFVNFLMDCRAQGYTVSIAKTYYSYADQRVRFNGMASTIYDRGGCTLAEAEEQAKAEGYFPGADEHQTGLAVNFVDEDGNAKFSTPFVQWMDEHCWEYGFIVRYPEGREEYTGKKAEAGHYRYVGYVAAEYIMRKGITLEEFKNAYDPDEEIVWLW